ncbi:MAG TPA: hypothetical protein VEY33_13805 [Gemmatimonadota bacterium]|nr:hypothetical protein [Gemmatimonadota bacterium]
MTRAVLAALVLHAAAFLLLRFPIEQTGEVRGPLVVRLEPADVDRDAANRPLVPASEPVSAAGAMARPGTAARSVTEPSPFPVTAIPFLRESPSAVGATALPSTGMTEAHAATLPLVVSAGGGVGRRRLERTPEQIATARAESLLFARMAGIAVAEARDIGAVGLANGGVTVAIPWQGFLPADRRDGAWRKERCSEGGGGKSDKAGEGEARRAQCS